MDETDEIVDEGAGLGGPARDGRSGFLAGVLLGAVVGAAVALLFAPEKGSRTRRRLGRRVRSLRRDAMEEMEEAGARTRRGLRRRRRHLGSRLSAAADRARGAIDDAF